MKLYSVFEILKAVTDPDSIDRGKGGGIVNKGGGGSGVKMLEARIREEGGGGGVPKSATGKLWT